MQAFLDKAEGHDCLIKPGGSHSRNFQQVHALYVRLGSHALQRPPPMHSKEHH
jgi:hypothetical protein